MKRPDNAIDEYIASSAPDSRPILERIRDTVGRAVPDATECISYRMPALRRGRVFLYFAAFKKHVGLYPPVRGSARLQSELAAFRGPKGNLQFPLDKPIPYALIGKVARTLAAEHGQKAPPRKARSK